MPPNKWDNIPDKPSLRNIQVATFGKPSDSQNQALQDVSKPHVESFNYFLNEGLYQMLKYIHPLEVETPGGDRIKVEIKNCKIGKPSLKSGADVRTYKIYPAECRCRGITYKSNFDVTVSWSKNGIIQEEVDRIAGQIPIMVKSDACNLKGMKPKELIAHGEEENEFGGYFIINGIERIIRLLIMQRRNYPIAMKRPSWKKRGDMFTEYGVSIRCVRPDQSGTTLVLHYLSDGTAKLMFTYKKELFFVPVMLVLKALIDETDYYIFKWLIKGKQVDSFYKGCMKNMLRQLINTGILNHDQAVRFIGESFRAKVGLPAWYTATDITNFLFKECICVHLEKDKDKFHLLVFMIKKLFALMKKECAIESTDNPMNQEILLPGHLYLILIKEKLCSWLFSVRLVLEKKLKTSPTDEVTPAMMRYCMSRAMNISRGVENVLATGNFSPRIDTTLMQYTGLTVVAEKLNFWRYLSHFRAVHRGAFFAEMRTTTVRKLLPEAWGFLCPVHTPDGAPCGLLNHLAAMCEVINTQPAVNKIIQTFFRYGMLPRDDPAITETGFYTVLLDGKIIGWMLKTLASTFVKKLRCMKSLSKEMIPPTIEIGFAPATQTSSQYPGIFVFTQAARMMRPVKNLMTKSIEMIGTMEQVYLHIAIKPSDQRRGVTIHMELQNNAILSIIAHQIPYSDFNQSPRNMYECQMGKQTMGTPCHALSYRSDNKLYSLHTPQSPLVRPKMHDYYSMDHYPLGTNAIVAVMSYTGFDMEDAIVINKSSMERGFAHGSIYKTELVNLRTVAGDRGTQKSLRFGRKKGDLDVAKFIDADGLPYIGMRLAYGCPLCSYLDTTTGDYGTVKYHSVEEAYVHDVKLLGNDTGSDIAQQISIKLRVPRRPVIGDKFASRHGQKGINSLQLYSEDMPFTEGGMSPDIIFNPHGFPSRMTIGMMIESMAGKCAAINGVLYDATPFTFSEESTAGDFFGECLTKAGYDYYGTERMFSGTDGRELEADIFFGVVYYQRLRHMVEDKYQVRTTGPVDPLTHQPVQGRKREGGVRFGEMERDALIAHGSSVTLYDRLVSCSDGTQQHVCGKCGNLLAPEFIGTPVDDDLIASRELAVKEWECRVCGTNKHIALVDLPYVVRYLTAELAAVNIKFNMKLGDFP